MSARNGALMLAVLVGALTLGAALNAGTAPRASVAQVQQDAGAAVRSLPGLVETEWLAAHLGDPHVRIIDVRTPQEYGKGRLPGSVCLSVHSVRGVVHNVSFMLLPRDMLARQFSLMGILPTDTVVFVPGEMLYDATMAAMACERLGHARYVVLNGGFKKWAAETRPAPARTASPSARRRSSRT